MRSRAVIVIGCLLLALPAGAAEAKKKRKAPVLGPVVTVTSAGNRADSPGELSTATATCPAGKQAVGGGFAAPLDQTSRLLVHSSYRSAPGSWTVEGLLFGGSGAVTAYAYCRNATPQISDISASVSFEEANGVRMLTPSCPSGRLVGGGFQGTPEPGAGSTVYPQVNQATSESTWTVVGVGNPDFGPRTLTAHAYCMERIRAPAIVAQATSATVAGPFAPIAGTSPVCPPRKKPRKRRKRVQKLPSAGGFSSTVNGEPTSPNMAFSESHHATTPGWFARANNASPSAGTVSVTSQAICY